MCAYVQMAECSGGLSRPFTGSFFIFPAFIGGLLAVALVLPLATTMLLSFGKCESYVLSAFLIVTSGFICILEFYYSPGALFEVRPQVITSHPAFLAGVQSAACRDQTFVGYSSQLAPLLASGRSWTGVIYYPGFVALTLLQNTLFVVFVAFLYFKREQIERRAPYFSYGVSYDFLAMRCSLARSGVSFRLSYRNDMSRLFAISNPLAGDYAVILVFLLALAVWVLYFQLDLKKVSETVTQIAQLVTVVGGAVFVKFDTAGTFFGTRASLMNILVLSLLFVFISALVAAFLLKEQRRRR